MIIENKALSLPEVEEIINKVEEKDEKKEIRGYIKKFKKSDLKRASKIRAELEKLDNIKIKPEHIIKVIDILPEDDTDINKIFSDVSLDKDESDKILEIVKQSK